MAADDSYDGRSSEITNVYLTNKNPEDWLNNPRAPEFNSSVNQLDGSLYGKAASQSQHSGLAGKGKEAAQSVIEKVEEARSADANDPVPEETTNEEPPKIEKKKRLASGRPGSRSQSKSSVNLDKNPLNHKTNSTLLLGERSHSNKRQIGQSRSNSIKNDQKPPQKLNYKAALPSNKSANLLASVLTGLRKE